MRRFLRKSSVGVEPLAVTMSGVRLGERALQIGVDSPGIAAAIAAKTGLTGLATIIVGDETAAGTARAALAEAGALADVHVGPSYMLPLADGAYDVVVLHAVGGLLPSLTSELRDRMLAECQRVLRVGGRLDRARDRFAYRVARSARRRLQARCAVRGVRGNDRRPAGRRLSRGANPGRPPRLPFHRGSEGIIWTLAGMGSDPADPMGLSVDRRRGRPGTAASADHARIWATPRGKRFALLASRPDVCSR